MRRDQTKQQTTPTLVHVGVRASNLEASLGFWRDALGLEVCATRDGACDLTDGHHNVRVFQHRGPDRPPHVGGLLDYLHIGVRVPDLTAAARRCEALGFRILSDGPAGEPFDPRLPTHEIVQGRGSRRHRGRRHRQRRAVAGRPVVTPATPLRIAIVGTEHAHSRSYQEILTQLSSARITAFLDDGGTIISALQDRPRYDDLEALLEKEPFEAAIVTVPPDQAPDVLVRLAAAGKHMLCDKPVCRTAAEMQQVLSAVERHGVRFAAGYPNRFRPVQERAKALIQQGRLGTVFALQASLFTTSVSARGADSYAFKKARSGGGILSWLGCHFIDMLLDITDRPVTGVKGFVATLGGDDIDVEDAGTLTIQFEGGAIADLMAGYTMPRNIDDPRQVLPEGHLAIGVGQPREARTRTVRQPCSSWWITRRTASGRSVRSIRCRTP